MMRIGVSIREAGWLLSRGEAQVRRAVASGKLRYAVRPTQLSAESVRAAFPDDHLRPLREAALSAVLQGRVGVPPPPSRYRGPLPITELPHLLRQPNALTPRSDVAFD